MTTEASFPNTEYHGKFPEEEMLGKPVQRSDGLMMAFYEAAGKFVRLEIGSGDGTAWSTTLFLHDTVQEYGYGDYNEGLSDIVHGTFTQPAESFGFLPDEA